MQLCEMLAQTSNGVVFKVEGQAMSDLALIIFAGIVAAIYLVSDHTSSKPRVNETEREIIEMMIEHDRHAHRSDI